MAPRTRQEIAPARSVRIFGVMLMLLTCSSFAAAAPLDQLPLDRWAKLREAERYQMQVAEKYFREQNWKTALAEYEKFLSLHERSDGAAYAQLKWSQCQVQLRKMNTAIKDGFQSVIDYWPDSPEAIAASYYIARTYKDMGEQKKAKQAYQTVLTKHKTHLAAVYARVDLLDIARLEGDQTKRVALWKELTFDIKRDADTQGVCAEASRYLAVHSWLTGAFDDGRKALETTYTVEQMPYHVAYYIRSPLQELTSKTETQAQGERVAQAATAYLKTLLPATTTSPETQARMREVWFAIGDVTAAARLNDQVATVYEELHKKLPEDDEVLGRLAAFYKSVNRRDDARKTYERYHDTLEGRGQVAYSYREEQKWEPAVSLYKVLAVQDEKKPQRWKAEQALTHRYASQCDEAVLVYQDLMQTDTERASQWHWEIANTYRDFHRWKEAIQTYRDTNNFPEAYKQMAGCHRQLKEFKEAISLYYQLIGSDPPSASWALLQVGYTQEESGDKEKAIKALQQVCAKYPKSSEASQAHSYLQDKFKINVTLGGETAE